jgi:hypothetical protein
MKYTPARLREVHEALVTHLRSGGTWETFPDMDRKTIRTYLAKDLPDFPAEPVRAAHRAGTRGALAVLQELAQGYRWELDPETNKRRKVEVKGDSKAAIFIVKNRGLSDDPRTADPDFEYDGL